MRKIWLIVKHDIGVLLRQRSFWILTLIMPVLLMGANGFAIIQGSQSDNQASQATPAPGEGSTIGLVDESGLIATIPAEYSALFVRLADRAAAQQALEAGEIGQYVLVPADYMATGDLEIYEQNFQLLQSGSFGGPAVDAVQTLISYNLTGSLAVATALRNPTPGSLTTPHALQPTGQGAVANEALGAMVASLMPLMYYFLLVMGSNYLMRSVVAEKENRTVEMLLMSVDPRVMMIAKILAMSVVTLIQVIVWVGSGIFLLRRGAALLNVASFGFPAGFLVWAILFLMLGYLLFASVMAAAGALANSAREGAQMTWLLILPQMPTLMFSQEFLAQPNGTLPTVLSLFPFSAPSAMVTRLALGNVPLWQVLASLGGLAVTTYLFIVLAGRFFRAGNLLSQEAFRWQRLLTGLRKTA